MIPPLPLPTLKPPPLPVLRPPLDIDTASTDQLLAEIDGFSRIGSAGYRARARGVNDPSPICATPVEAMRYALRMRAAK